MLSLARQTSPNARIKDIYESEQKMTEGFGHVQYLDLRVTGTFVAVLDEDKGEAASLQTGISLQASGGTTKRIKKSGDSGTRGNPIVLDGPETLIPSKTDRGGRRRLRRIKGTIDQSTRRFAGESHEGKQRQQQTPSYKHECVACGHAKRLRDFTTLSKCSHSPVLCNPCFAAWIATQVQESKAQIRCPEAACEVTLEHAEVKQYASLATFSQ